MKRLISLTIFIFASYSVIPQDGQRDELELFALDDKAFIEDIAREGFYGRFLELRGENQRALEYYRSDEGNKTEEAARLSYLEWYLGYSEMPLFSDTRSLKNLILQYLISGKPENLDALERSFPGAFELDALRSHNLFLMPFLFSPEPLEPAIAHDEDAESSEVDVVQPSQENESAVRVETRNGIPWSYDDEQAGKEETETEQSEVLIQLGSFRLKNNALEHIRELSKKGIDAEIREKRNDNDLFYITVIPAGDDIQRSLLRLKEQGVEGFPLYP